MRIVIDENVSQLRVCRTVANEQDMMSIAKGMHIHPALPELILVTLQNLREP